ncbi:hypothetical protein IQ266_03100 [filamentous cyanobacterium LEGE 11480]|uniref:Uncharacterized protein n=1 Tax=Romeriopsis navalis LEGE 11480 TaxID=2777977 RepID=A0A928Z2V9_9CYAN|nr:hypothetical protein [Romeriopsis navalis]MBE9028745.1 hypothetical protein [Romeriopsis navalis LEGE 11480]
MDQLATFIQTVFDNPPVAYNPVNQTLKGWALYCLRDRGLKVDTVVNNADFEVQSKVGSMRFKVAKSGDALDPDVAWIVLDANGQQAKIVPAASK